MKLPNCNHEYILGEVLEGKENCKNCGLLRSTIENNDPEKYNNPMKQEEWEKSVDDAVDLNWETPYEQKKFIQSLLDKQKQEYEEKLFDAHKYGFEQGEKLMKRQAIKEERTRIIEWAKKKLVAIDTNEI
jgi:hypothetical protein